jgi:sec-independent protein translocase protein TatA
MTTTLCFLNLGAPEIIIIALLVLLLFGGKKIPELMRGIGKGVRTFRDGMKEVEDEVGTGIDVPKAKIEK